MASLPPLPLPRMTPAMRAGVDVVNTHRPARTSARREAAPTPRNSVTRKDFTGPLGLPDDATNDQILNAVSDVVASNKRKREARASAAVAASRAQQEQAAEDAAYEAAFGSSPPVASPQPASAAKLSDEALYAAAFGDDRG